MSLFMTKEKVY